MELRPYTEEDLALTEALEGDPEVMRYLAGPATPERIREAHHRRARGGAPGAVDWWLVIEPQPGGPPAGTIGIWESELDGATIHEVGWMVLPEFQGRGIASEALALLMRRARAEPRLTALHAFPATANAASNALCRKFGFELREERDFEFRGRAMRCGHWVADVGEAASVPD